ncbi:hypothetical protein ES703_85624 [subsurface metagenome]
MTLAPGFSLSQLEFLKQDWICFWQFCNHGSSSCGVRGICYFWVAFSEELFFLQFNTFPGWISQDTVEAAGPAHLLVFRILIV